jgi:pSer/pThr/pTyr-binding forkhead associated (FHA) protein/Mg-chelatase subunit ChlD
VSLAIAAGLGIVSSATSSAAAKSAIDVVFVLDNSGSMRQNDPEFLTRAAVAKFADAMAADAETVGRVAIVLFDGRARLVQPLTLIEGDDDGERLTSPLSTLDFAGQWTNSPSGVERALYELRENGREDADKAIILLTDGRIDTGVREDDVEAGRWLREDLASESRAEGIRIFGIAFTDAADYQLIQALALKTRASYYRAFEAAELESVVGDVLEQISLATDDEALASTNASPLRESPESANGLPPVASGTSNVDNDRFEIFGWLPIALLLVGGSLLWWRRGRRESSEEPVRHEPFVDESPVAPTAQLLDMTGRLGYVGNVIELSRDSTRIGRDPHNDLSLDNEAVSSEHAMIEVRDGRYWLEDHRSTNGTLLGDQRLVAGEAVPLKGGDHIRLGDIDLMFVLSGYVPGGETVFLDPSTTTPPPSTSRPAPTRDAAIETDADFADEVLPESAMPQPVGESDANSPISLLPRLEENDPESEEAADEMAAPERDATPVLRDASSQPAEALVDVYRNVLDFHLERVEELSPALSAFVARGFDDEMRSALAVAANELTRAALRDDSIQEKSYTASSIRYLICAVPDSPEGARDRFGSAYGGFTRLLTGALQDETFRRERCAILAVLTFGRSQHEDAEPWVSLSIVPDDGQEPQIDLLSYEFLTEEERREIEPEPSQDARHSGGR